MCRRCILLYSAVVKQGLKAANSYRRLRWHFSLCRPSRHFARVRVRVYPNSIKKNYVTNVNSEKRANLSGVFLTLKTDNITLNNRTLLCLKAIV